MTFLNAGSSVHFYKLLLLFLHLSAVSDPQKLDSAYLLTAYTFIGWMRVEVAFICMQILDISIVVCYMINIDNSCILFDWVDITDLSLTDLCNFAPSFLAPLQLNASQEK